MYRPDGWKNPWGSKDVIVQHDENFMRFRTADGTSPERVLAEDRRDIYEAGADAMLKALVENGWLEEYNMVDEDSEEKE